jgi:hypothetical protein
MLQRVNRVERSNTQEYSKGFHKECVQEFFQGLKSPEKDQEG